MGRATIALVLFGAAACGSGTNEPIGPGDGAVPVEVAEIALPPPPAASSSPRRASVAEAPPLVPPSASVRRRRAEAEPDSTESARRAALGPVKPRGTVTIGQPTHPDVANGTQIAATLVGGFRSCYRRGLAHHPSAKGSLVLELTIDHNGEVSLVKPSKSQLPAEIVACAAARAKVATFASPSAPPATVTIPLTFELKP
jgi:hypothetical protein